MIQNKTIFLGKKKESYANSNCPPINEYNTSHRYSLTHTIKISLFKHLEELTQVKRNKTMKYIQNLPHKNFKGNYRIYSKDLFSTQNRLIQLNQYILNKIGNL